MASLKFIHISKTGGSSIESVGARNGHKWGKLDDVKFPDTYKIFWHTPIKLYDINPYEGYDLFTVVRNPYDRVLSEFHWIQLVYGLYIDAYTIDDFNRIVQTEIRDRYDNIFMEDHIDPANKKCLPSGNDQSLAKSCAIPWGHYFSQWDYFTDKLGNRIIKHVLRFEKLQEEFNNLMIAYQYDDRITPDDKENSCVRKFTIRDFYPETIRLINDVYHEDFVNFGYDKM